VTPCPRCAELTALLTAERERSHRNGNEIMRLRAMLDRVAGFLAEGEDGLTGDWSAAEAARQVRAMLAEVSR